MTSRVSRQHVYKPAKAQFVQADTESIYAKVVMENRHTVPGKGILHKHIKTRVP